MIKPVIESRIDDKMVEKLKIAYARSRGSYVTVGVHEGTRGYAGEKAPTVAQVAWWMEYGAPNARVPARPFLAPALALNRPAIAANLGRQLAFIALDKVTVANALRAVGRQVKLFVQKSIMLGPGPKLSGSWDPPRGYLGRKRELNQPSQTLIATGTLLRSIQYRLVLGDKAAVEDASAEPKTAIRHHNANRRADARLRNSLSLKKQNTPSAGALTRKNKP